MVKKIVIISFLYGVFYYFAVYKLYGVTGEWHWNLFEYFGIIGFSVITIGYYAVALFVSKGEKLS